MTEDLSEPWVGMKEICIHLGVSRDTVSDWLNRRGLPGYKIGRSWKFKISEIDHWLRSNAENPTADDNERGANA